MKNQVQALEARAMKVPSKAYKRESLELLKYIFPNISVVAIRATHQEFRFPQAFEALSTIARDQPRGQQNALPPYLNGPRHMKRPRRSTDPELLAEIDTIPQMNTKENRVPPLWRKMKMERKKQPQKKSASVNAALETFRFRKCANAMNDTWSVLGVCDSMSKRRYLVRTEEISSA